LDARQRPISWWWLVLASLAGYLLFAFWFPLFPPFNHVPLADIFTFSPTLAGGLAYAAVFGLLYWLYLLSWQRAAHQQQAARLSVPLILLAAAVYALPLLFTFPINANDIYRYFIRGRITVVHQQSPYDLAPADFPDDPYLPLAGEWAGETSPYGPAWEGLAALVTAVTQDNLPLALLSFKLLGLLAHLAAAGLIWLCLAGRDPAERAGRTLLWAWNPALLLIFVMDAHNDALMIVWLLLGYWLMQRRHWLPAVAALTLAPLTKPIGLLPLPFFIIAIVRELPGWPARLRFLLVGGLTSLAIILLAFFPFGSPLELANRLWREATEGASFSMAALTILLGRQVGVDLFTVVAENAPRLFILVALVLVWLGWRGRSALRGAADIFAAYLVQALNFRIWYAAWPFPWLLLEEDKESPARAGGQGDKEKDNALSPRLLTGLLFLLTSQLSVIWYSHVRIYWFGRDHVLAHLTGVPLTFLLPVLLAYWWHKRSKGVRRET
jgi:hypothetical protein